MKENAKHNRFNMINNSFIIHPSQCPRVQGEVFKLLVLSDQHIEQLMHFCCQLRVYIYIYTVLLKGFGGVGGQTVKANEKMSPLTSCDVKNKHDTKD